MLHAINIFYEKKNYHRFYSSFIRVTSISDQYFLKKSLQYMHMCPCIKLHVNTEWHNFNSVGGQWQFIHWLDSKISLLRSCYSQGSYSFSATVFQNFSRTPVDFPDSKFMHKLFVFQHIFFAYFCKNFLHQIQFFLWPFFLRVAKFSFEFTDFQDLPKKSLVFQENTRAKCEDFKDLYKPCIRVGHQATLLS